MTPMAGYGWTPAQLPGTEDEHLLYSQCWPGIRTESSSFPQTPVAVLDGGFPADDALRFAVHLDKAGASVRRLSPEAEVPTMVRCPDGACVSGAYQKPSAEQISGFPRAPHTR